MTDHDAAAAWQQQLAPVRLRFRRRTALKKPPKRPKRETSTMPSRRRPSESIAQFACRQLVAYLIAREPKLERDVEGHNWFPVFARLDRDGSGFINMDELKYKMRYELRVDLSGASVDSLARAIDVAGTGRVGTREFANFMRTHYETRRAPRRVEPLRDDPEDGFEGTPSQRSRVLGHLKRAFGLRHAPWVGGDWYPLVARYDRDSTRTLVVDEFRALVRDALELRPRAVSDDDIEALLESCRRASVSSRWPVHERTETFAIRLGHIAEWLNKNAPPDRDDDHPARGDCCCCDALLLAGGRAAASTCTTNTTAWSFKQARWDYSTSTPYSLVEEGQPVHTFDDIARRPLPPSRRKLPQRVFRRKTTTATTTTTTTTTKVPTTPRDRPENDHRDIEEDDDHHHHRRDDDQVATRHYASRRGRFVVAASPSSSAWRSARLARASNAKIEERSRAEANETALKAAWDAVEPLLDEWRCAKSIEAARSNTVEHADDGTLVGHLATRWAELRYAPTLDLGDLGLTGSLPPVVFALLAHLDSYDLRGNRLAEDSCLCKLALATTRLRSKRRVGLLDLAPRDHEAEFQRNLASVFKSGDADKTRNNNNNNNNNSEEPADDDDDDDRVVLPAGLGYLPEVVDVELPPPDHETPPRDRLGLDRIASISKLRRLALAGQRLDGRGLGALLAELAPVAATLQDLNLAGCRCGGGLDGITNFAEMRQLHLSDCELEGLLAPFPRTVTCVSLHHNHLSGPVRLDDNETPDLRDLFLHHNRFQGPVPVARLATLKHLEHAWFDHNTLDAVTASPDLDALRRRCSVRVDAVLDDDDAAPARDDAEAASSRVEAALRAKPRQSDWHAVLTRCDRDGGRGIDVAEFASAIRRELRATRDEIPTTDVAAYFDTLLDSLGSTPTRQNEVPLAKLALHLTSRVDEVSRLAATVVGSLLQALPPASSLRAVLQALEHSGAIHFRTFRTYVRRGKSDIDDADLRAVWRQIDQIPGTEAVALDDLAAFVGKIQNRHVGRRRRPRSLTELHPEKEEEPQRRRVPSTLARRDLFLTSWPMDN